ncbi:MAG: response regulator [Candidatus Aenigmatarchaeota archaeon]
MKKMKILLVEDQEENRRAAQQYFTQKDHVHVEYAIDYNQAVEKLNKELYDGIITDIFMPQETGTNERRLGIEAYKKIYFKIYDDFEREAAKEEGSYFIHTIDHVLNCCYELKEKLFEGNNNQPLGVLIAEKAEELGIPCVIATSLFHHHVMAEPVFYYVYHSDSLKKCKIYEGEIVTDGSGRNLKTTQEYWDEVYTALLSRIKEEKGEAEHNAMK